jgi:hypothetical protein
MQCKMCGKEIKQVGNRTKEYCSDRCRIAFKRSNPNIQSEQIQSEQVNPNKVSVTDNHEAKRHVKTIKECLDAGILQRWLDNIEDQRYYTHLTKDEQYLVIVSSLPMSEAIDMVLNG